MKQKHLLSLFLAVLLSAVPTSSWAIDYITDIATSEDTKPDAAKRKLTDDKYDIDGWDLNGDTGSDNYVYLGRKKSTDYTNAITNIVLIKNPASGIVTETKGIVLSDGRTYYLAKHYGSHDWNTKAKGDHILVLYTREKPELGYVTELAGNRSVPNSNPICIVNGTNIGGAGDFNSGTGKRAIYYAMSKHTPTSKNPLPLVEEHFKVVNLGGGMYHFTIPLGVKDENGDVYVVGHPTTSGESTKILYRLKNDTEWKKIYHANHQNYEKYGFDKAWRCDIYPTENGKLLDDSTFQTPWQSKYYYQGNTANLKLYSLVWKPSEEGEIEAFRLESEVEKNYSGSANYEIQTTISAKDPEAPEGMNNINIVDPILDFTAGKPGSSAIVGTQFVNVITAGNMKYASIWDKNEKKFLQSGLLESSNLLSFNFPPSDKQQELTVMFYGDDRQVTDSGMSTCRGFFAVPLTVKPMHSIRSMSVQAEKTIDEKGELKHQNRITWKVNNVRQEDVMDVDEYIIQRAYHQDFSDAVSIGSIPVDILGADSTELVVKTISNTEDVGTYTFIDDMEGCSYNPDNKDPDTKIYYRVVRGVVLANWGTNYLGDFAKEDSVILDNRLATVHSIKVEKTKNFEKEGTVKVRVELTNRNTNGTVKQVIPDILAAHDTIGIVLWNKTHQKYFGGMTADGAGLCDSIESAQKFFLVTGVTNNSKYQYELLDKEEYENVLVATIGKVEWGKSTNTSRFKLVDELADGNGPYSIGYYSPTSIEDDLYLGVTDGKKLAGFKTPLAPEWDFYTIGNEPVWDKNASIIIKRYAEERDTVVGADGKKTPVDLAAKTITIYGSDVKWDNTTKTYYAEIEDIQALPYTHYYYRAAIDGSQSNYPLANNDSVTTTKEEADACVKKTLAPFAHFEATKGTLKGGVALEWQVDEGLLDGFKLEKREYSESDTTSYTRLPLKDSKTTNYMDVEAQSGTLYEYKVTAQCTVYGKTYEASNTVYGWNPYYGTVKGRVTLKNNAPMPTKVRVTIKGDKTVKVKEVRDPKTNEIIIPGYDKLYEDECFADKGAFEFDSIPYLSDGTEYVINIDADGAKFVLEGQDNAENVKLSLTDQSFEYSTLHYICNDTRQFSGRVLYKNSTMPVRDCQFLMNGHTVLDANNKPVVTDSKGEFSFSLPSMTMTLQAFKNGHTFENDGYIMGRGSDTTKVAHQFKPTDDYDGLILDDATTIRLAGRFIGGNKQAKLPIGMGLSKNNLGDDLYMVLELEGDNTSRITYYKDNPDKSTRQEMFTQKVKRTDLLNPVYTDTTMVTFEKKRIIVVPDVKTGEFCIDLAPTKYKITEMSAKGYTTLFNEDEGYQVLDLSNDTALIVNKYAELGTKGDTIRTYTAEANSVYQRVVHNPVDISYEQLQYGLKQNFLGSEKITELNILGERKTSKVAKYDKATKTTTYTFGRPLYESGKEYTLKVSAHENFYYNGDRTTTPDIVYLESGKLKVRNELVSSVSSAEYELDKEGTATFTFVADNPEFSVSGEDALRNLTMEVETNGYFYHGSDTLRAYVTGARDKGKDVLAKMDGPINVIDVVRDPYGSKSYTWREKGTEYNWDYQMDFALSIGLDINMKLGTSSEWFTGMWAGVGGGAVAGVPGSTSNWGNITVPLPSSSVSYVDKGEYHMTLNDRISTSADPLDVGAMADVYVGFINTYELGRVETFSTIDSVTYAMVKPAIDKGAIRIVKEGRDADNNKFYLAISEKLKLGKGGKKEFVYTQKHILGTVIPQLVQTMASMILVGDSADIQAQANASGKLLYRLKDGKEFGDSCCWEPIYPRSVSGDIIGYNAPDITPESIENTINEWERIIADNEKKKVDLITSSASHDSYSISSATKIEHSEAASAFYKKDSWVVNLAGWNLTGGNSGQWLGKIGESASGSVAKYLAKNNTKFGKIGKEEGTINKTEKGDDPNEPGGKKDYTATTKISGFTFTIDVSPRNSINFDRSVTKKHISTAGSGFVLETNDNSYLDIDVYRNDDYQVNTQLIETFYKKEDPSERDEWADDFYHTITRTDNDNDDNMDYAKVHDFVFTVHGGAERQPWYEPDTTLFYVDVAKKPMPLTARTLRIDNPKISITNPVVSNIPIGEKAILYVRLTNESEVTSNMKDGLMNPSFFKLFLDEKSCPDGLAITMDGMPLTDGRVFHLMPGESITKTIQVERAGKQYNYENVRLGFRDEAYSLFDYAAISVNYLPASTPVKMVRPVDKWVMNTLSAKDEEGRFYLPIEVNGFNINHDNFDHIELQYKKKTEGDSKWVNICSYYSDESLYDAASGTKAMIENESSTIRHRFYGEADPIEMEYDLRAVSFCRLGTGYVTAVSNVMSGLKDTRNPEIFGKPKPTNGVLTFEDVISFPFNEPIAYNYLDKTANFQITGLTNNLNKVYDTALRFPEYSAHDVPTSKVKRSLAGQDFTWEAMVKLDGGSDVDELFSIYDTDLSDSTTTRYFTMMYDSGTLEALMDGVIFISKKLTQTQEESLHNKLTNVAVSFTNARVGIKKQMRFYLDGTEIEMDSVLRMDHIDFEENKLALQPAKEDYHIISNVYGKIFLGSYMKGIMVDARLWDKALSGAELSSKRMKVLSNSEPSLMCYWPMDEMTGNVLHDKVNGTDLHFSRQTWQMPDGQHSLRLDGEGIKLKTLDTDFMRAEYNDFTLSFWTQIDSEQTKADTVYIFNAGSKLDKQHFAIYMDEENVNVKSGEFCQSFAGRSELADNQWHLVTAVTNKSYNTSAVYLDGKLVMIAGGDDFHGMPISVSIGDENFHGNFDNISFWHLAIPSNSLTTVSNAAPTGREMGLAFFLPFETDQANSQDTHDSVFCPDNMVVKKDENGKELPTHDRALPEDIDINKVNDDQSYPPVKASGIIQNIPFTWTATNNELQINLNKRDAEINHQYINVTVRDVEDLAGNTLVNPQMMRVYVDRNVLNWDDSKVDIKVKYGEPETITRKLNNKSGRTIYYTLENNCTWLKLSETNGEAMPMNYNEIQLEVSDGLAPGEYYTTVYAVDEDNLGSPLTISVNVEADEPEWTVTDAKDYNLTMNIMGRVKLNNEGGREYFDTDKRDIVAAFYNGVCVGKAYITVNDVNNPMVNLTVLGNNDMAKKNLTFLLWNAATNTTSVIVPDTKNGTIAFANGTIIGCPPAKPVIFTTTNEKKQTWNLETGWNWVSLNIKPKNTSINKLFDSNNVFSAGDVIMVNGKSSEMSAKNSWSSGVNANGKYTFQIYVHKPVQATVFGYEFKEEERYVKLDGTSKQTGVWYHLPYLLNVDQPINVAMSGLMDNKNDGVGTVIKDRKKFAVLNNDKKWVGSLDYMHPGEGYFIKYFGKDTINVAFTNNEKSTYTKLNSWNVSEEEEDIISKVAPANSEVRTMMPVIASIANNADFEEDDEIVAFAKGNAIGSAKVTELEDGKQLFFISLNAEDGNIVHFAHVRGTEVLAKSSSSIVYDGNTVTGTLDVPYTIDFSDTISNNDDAYGISGEKYGKAENIKNRKGVFIIGNEKIAQ